MAARSFPRNSAVCLMLFVAVYSFYFVQGGEGEFVLIDEPMDPVYELSKDAKNRNAPITGTEDEYKRIQNTPTRKQQDGPMRIGEVVHNLPNPQSIDEGKKAFHFSKPPLQKGPITIGKGRPLHKVLLRGARDNSTFGIKTPSNAAQLLKPLSASKHLKPLTAKLTDKHSDSANNPNQDLRNLTCKNFLIKVNTGLPWDNDFLFSENANYQATRRATEIKVLDAYEDNKDFRGAFFNKFSSSEEPGGVKAYFLLRFRANGKFLGKLLDKIGQGNISAAGCYPDTPITQCPSSCPSTCAPTCLQSCCHPSVSAVLMPPPPPQPVTGTPVNQCPGSCPATCAPTCLQSCCQPSVSAPIASQPAPLPVAPPPTQGTPVTQCSGSCPSTCAPKCLQSCCQPPVSAPVPMPPPPPTQPVPGTPVTQCPGSCPSTCAPTCLQSCCQQSGSFPVAPQPVYQPAPVSLPPAPPQPVPGTPGTQCPGSCPSTCAPTCQQSCCQSSVSAPVPKQPIAPVAPRPVYQRAPVPMFPPSPQPFPAAVPRPQFYQPRAQQGNTQYPFPQYPMSQLMSWPGSQCSSSCSPSCAPICSPICCQSYNKRNTGIKTSLKKQALQEEKH